MPDSFHSKAPELNGSAGAIRIHQLLAIVVLVFALLPVSNWIAGGHSSPWYTDRLLEWMWGSTIVVGVGLVVGILGRRISWQPHDGVHRVAKSACAHPLRTGVLLSGIGLLLYALVAQRVYSAAALHLDEIAQLIQARIFADGRLYRDVAQYPEFFSLQHIVELDGKWFSQFPPGWPLMMVPFVLLNAAWLSGPLYTAASVGVFWGIARRVCTTEVQALAAAVLFMAAPFVVFMGSSHMNHVGALFWFLCAAYAIVRMGEAEASGIRWSIILGLALGAMATIRPLDAAAAALPAGIWVVWRTVQNRMRWPELLASGVALAIPLVALGWYNAETAGSPFTFAYTRQWGAAHGLGFHAAPWGAVHTPWRGVELINLYLLRLQSYLFESPVPSLVFPLVALALTTGLRTIDRYLLGFALLLLTAYFSYWHDGFYLGPRFVYLLVPGMVLWTVSLPGAVMAFVARRGRAVSPGIARWGVAALAASALIAAFVNAPARGRAYAAGLISSRANWEEALRDLDPEKSLVFVRETWGAQLMARLWRIDVDRGFAELSYSRSDACALDRALRELESNAARGEAARISLIPLLRDSLRLVRSPYSPDDSERLLPGASYDSVCAARISEDVAGSTLMAPLIAARGWGLPIARDLGPMNGHLVDPYPGRDLYLLRTRGSESGAPLELLPISRDSVLANWRGSMR